MTNPEDYLQKLQKSLRGLPKEKQNEILAEIGSHIEEGLENGRFSNDPQKQKEWLLAELGSPTVMSQEFLTFHAHRRWRDFLVMLIPFLLIDSLPYVLLFLQIMRIIPENTVNVTWFIFELFALGIIVGVLWLCRRWQLWIVALWWVAALVAVSLAPFLSVPWLSGWGFYAEYVQWWHVALVTAVLLPFLWLLWQVRYDGLMLVFGTLPLTLGLLTISLLNMQINVLLNDGILASYFLEPLLRALMWCGVASFYFLPTNRWLRWLGIGGSVCTYLYVINGFTFTLAATSPIVNPSFLSAVWVWLTCIFIGGILLVQIVAKRQKIMAK